MSTAPKFQMILDLIGWNLVLLAFICFAYVATVQKTVGMEIIVPIFFIFGGLTFGFGTGILKTDWHLTANIIRDDLLWFIIVFGAIMTVQVSVVATLSHTPFGVKFDIMDLKAYGIMIAIAEEILFRGFMLPWSAKMYKMFPFGHFLAIFQSAGAWTIFHFAVYGTQPIALLLVLMVGIVIGFISWQKKRLWIFMGAHALVNIVAFGGITPLTIVLPVLLMSVLVIVWITARKRSA